MMLFGSLSQQLHKQTGSTPPEKKDASSVPAYNDACSGPAYIDSQRIKLSFYNVVAFVFAMAINGTSNTFSRATQAEIAEEWDVRIMPAGWAFSIWGIIYLFLFSIVAYQAVPSNSLPLRSNAVIFDDIGKLFVVNMVANGLWLACFGFNTPVAFFIALLDIIVLLASGVKILMIISRSEVTNFERFLIGGGFTLYNGWVTAATILNVSFFLKGCGVGKDEEWESGVTCAVLVVALFVYSIVSYLERNPCYGLVFLWPLLAIKGEQKEYTDIENCCMALIIIDAVAMVGLMMFCYSENKKRVECNERI